MVGKELLANAFLKSHQHRFMKQQAGAPPSQQQKLFGLDHLRALAIIMVFVYHYGRIFPHPEWTNAISVFGWTGVDLFFVLSGYLIASQLFLSLSVNKIISVKVFFIKRFFRILPAYFTVVALYFLFTALREREAPAPLWKYLTFTQNIGLDLRTQGTFSHAWSLCIEEQFYLLFPFILLILQHYKIQKGFWLLLVLFLFGFVARLYSWYVLIYPHAGQDNFWVYWQEWMYYPTFCRLDGLVFGVSIAAIFQYQPLLKEWVMQHGNGFLTASLLVFCSAYFLCINQQIFSASIFGFPLVDFGYGLLVIGAISPNTFLYKIQSRATTKIAALSFAVYLTHKIIIHQTQEQFGKLNIGKESNLMFFICILTCLLGALLLNEIIEKPFLKWRSHILKSI